MPRDGRQAGRQAGKGYVRTTHRPDTTTHHAAHPRRYRQPLEAQHSTDPYPLPQTNEKEGRERSGIEGDCPISPHTHARTHKSVVQPLIHATCVRVDVMHENIQPA
mmetsp:Transcript_13072/g.31230  ORF Transcript_13072/g.31230 Transcript_13072/m.31230 type:complete len:106 (+) Transcript_13072:199-516(+)